MIRKRKINRLQHNLRRDCLTTSAMDGTVDEKIWMEGKFHNLLIISSMEEEDTSQKDARRTGKDEGLPTDRTTDDERKLLFQTLLRPCKNVGLI